MSKDRINILQRTDSAFPVLLGEISDAPRQIYLLGELPDSGIPRVSIVGTRKATQSGQSLAKLVAQKLSEAGAVVVSGLAMGIDTAAHEGAIAAHAKTIAVLANGLDSIYPRQNENLAYRILESSGAIISEYPPGTPPFPSQFLERNRIISGLSLATVIIEAPHESGALVTARLAAEQGREVLVFPGSPTHPNYRGSHDLIRDGARLVSSVEDILEDLGLYAKSSSNLSSRDKLKEIQNEEQRFIFKIIEGAGHPVRIYKIIELTKLEPRVVSREITFLTINNFIRETERGYTS